MTPRQRLAALKRAERTMDAACKGHPDLCGCALCDARMAVWTARIDVERPGFRGYYRTTVGLPEAERLRSASEGAEAQG